MLAIIGGTGVYDLTLFKDLRVEPVSTPYGTIDVTIGTYNSTEIAFITRHGAEHKMPPHRINYKGNIFALKELGVTSIIATTAVGSLKKEIPPGTFVFCDQFIDFTKNRSQTFFDGPPLPVAHVDMSFPYCSTLRDFLIDLAEKSQQFYCSKGTYICTEGPRFESAAEVQFYGEIGGSVVGMTGVPEVVLAREAEICYATISMVTNLGAGLSESILTHEEVLDVMKENQNNFQELIKQAIQSWQETPKCSCQSALREYGGFKKYMGVLK